MVGADRAERGLDGADVPARDVEPDDLAVAEGAQRLAGAARHRLGGDDALAIPSSGV